MARPAPVTWVTLLMWVLVGIGALASLAAVMNSDELAGRPITLPDGTVPRADYAPVVVVMCIVIASLLLVLLEFFRGGHTWARNTLAPVLLLLVFGVGTLLATAPPTSLLLTGGAAALVALAMTALLFHPHTVAFLADPSGWVADQDDVGRSRP